MGQLGLRRTDCPCLAPATPANLAHLISILPTVVRMRSRSWSSRQPDRPSRRRRRWCSRRRDWRSIHRRHRCRSQGYLLRRSGPPSRPGLHPRLRTVDAIVVSAIATDATRPHESRIQCERTRMVCQIGRQGGERRHGIVERRLMCRAELAHAQDGQRASGPQVNGIGEVPDFVRRLERGHGQAVAHGKR